MNRLRYISISDLSLRATLPVSRVSVARIRYNRPNQPTEVTFGEGHRQTITYDGFGRKIRVDYSQVPDAMIVGHQSIYTDDWYQLTSTREYVGPHVFCDGRLEYSAFPGGYFDPDKGAMYYITDWQGNNAAVVSKDGIVAQQTIYYPYGEPTIEPEGQRYLYGGKEREHAGGRNAYDFGARSLTPYGRWSVADPLAEKSYPISPYSMCAGDPINFIDLEGKEKICLSNDLVLILAMGIFKDDNTKLHIFTHGRPNSFLFSIAGKGNMISNSSEFEQAMKVCSERGDIDNYYGMEIVLHSCNTGRSINDKESIAQKLSRDFPNVIITAPDASVSFLTSGRESLFRRTRNNQRIYSDDYKWLSFFRGNEIPSYFIPIIRLLLSWQKNANDNRMIEDLIMQVLNNIIQKSNEEDNNPEESQNNK